MQKVKYTEFLNKKSFEKMPIGTRFRISRPWRGDNKLYLKSRTDKISNGYIYTFWKNSEDGFGFCIIEDNNCDILYVLEDD